MNVAKTIQIDLKNGQLLTLDVSDALLEKVRDSFMLESRESVTEAHVKYYITSAMKNTLEAADGRKTS